jgi:hypothetical protein
VRIVTPYPVTRHFATVAAEQRLRLGQRSSVLLAVNPRAAVAPPIVRHAQHVDYDRPDVGGRMDPIGVSTDEWTAFGSLETAAALILGLLSVRQERREPVRGGSPPPTDALRAAFSDLTTTGRDLAVQLPACWPTAVQFRGMADDGYSNSPLAPRRRAGDRVPKRELRSRP